MPKINQNRSSRLATVMLRGTPCIFRHSQAKINQKWQLFKQKLRNVHTLNYKKSN